MAEKTFTETSPQTVSYKIFLFFEFSGRAIYQFQKSNNAFELGKRIFINQMTTHKIDRAIGSSVDSFIKGKLKHNDLL